MVKKTLREQVSSMREILTLFNDVVNGGFALQERKVSRDHTVYVDIHVGEKKGDKIFFGMAVFDTPFEDRKMTADSFGIEIPLDYVWPQRSDGHRSYIAMELQEKFNLESFRNGDLKVRLLGMSVDNVQKNIRGPVYLHATAGAFHSYRTATPRDWWMNPFGNPR